MSQANIAAQGANPKAKQKTTVSYIDANGARKRGVTAPSAAQPEQSDTLTHWQALARDYEELYRSQTQDNNTAAAAATEKTLREIEAQIQGLNDEYKRSHRQLYRDYREDERALPQQLAASGYTGGMSESSRVRLESGYQELFGASERERLAGVASLRAAGVEADYENRRDAAERNAAARSEYEKNRRSLSDEEFRAAQKRAETLAAIGDFTGYRALGYSQTEIDRLFAAWALKNRRAAAALYGR